MKKIKLLLSPEFKEEIKKSSNDWRYPIFAFKWKIARFLTKARKVSVDGIELTIPCENWITHFRWYLFKTKEVEVRNYIKEFMNEGDVFFDIGANIGVFSVYAAKIHQKSRIYCFEPEYSNLNLLKQNILANQIDNQMTIFSVALSDEVGFSKLHLSDTESGAAVHTESRRNISTTDEGYKVVWKEGIMTTTLDYFCKENNIYPNCIKIDTDGNEFKILKGAFNTLKNSALRSLIIEMPLHNEKQSIACENILKDSGFMPFWSNREKTKNEIWAKNT